MRLTDPADSTVDRYVKQMSPHFLNVVTSGATIVDHNNSEIDLANFVLTTAFRWPRLLAKVMEKLHSLEAFRRQENKRTNDARSRFMKQVTSFGTRSVEPQALMIADAVEVNAPLVHTSTLMPVNHTATVDVQPMDTDVQPMDVDYCEIASSSNDGGDSSDGDILGVCEY